MNGIEKQPSHTETNTGNHWDMSGSISNTEATNLAIKALSNTAANTQDNTTTVSETISKKGRLAEKISTLLEKEPPKEWQMRAREEIICGKNRIENQRISIVDQRDMGLITLSFKLKRSDVLSFFEEQQDEAKKSEHLTAIKDYAIGRDDYWYLDHNAFTFTKENLKVNIASPDCLNRTALGLVRIEAPSDMPPANIEHGVSQILDESFGIKNALDPPTEDEIRNYKNARYGWQHKIKGGLNDSELQKAENLEYKEVYPGYTTLIEPGIHKKYLALSCKDARAAHVVPNFTSAKTIANILTHGLASATERGMRGLLKRGMSTRDDIRSGGADNVFTSTGTEITRKCALRGTTIVFKPELFDRTDWYSYECDNFGRTNEDDFSNRISPEDLFRDNCDQSNENMFRTGIGPQYIEQIIVNKTEDKEELINGLKQLNITSFDGKTIEELIISREELPIMSKEKIERIRSGEDTFPFKNIFYSASNCDLGKTLEIIKPLITDKNIDECRAKIIDTVQQNYKRVLKNIAENGLEKAARLDDDERQFYRYLQDELGIDLKTIAPTS